MTARPISTRTRLAAILAAGALLAAAAGAVAVAEPPGTAVPPAIGAPAGAAGSPGSGVVTSAVPAGGAGGAEPAELSVAAEALAGRAAEQGVRLERAVLAELDRAGQADFWVGLADRADLSRADEIEDWAQRGRHVHDQLLRTARASQASLTARLRAQGVEFETFWIANAVLVRGGDPAVLGGVLVEPEVAEVRADQEITLPDPVAGTGAAEVAAVEWGVANIRADQVWSDFGVRGEGIVVGSIDTGVQYTHPTLVEQYRGNLGDGGFTHDYHWWDPSGVCPSPEPCDNNNHGTHTTGTIVGDDGAGNQIGVAPGAQWIAAKGCEEGSCSTGALLSAGQFMLAPTDLTGQRPRPELRPHIVNNSWGGAGGLDFYDATVAAWVAAGMFPVFSNGNTGPGCGSVGSPADGPDAYGVGAYDIDNQLANFSSRGPGRDGEISPQIAAPGVRVRSAVPGGYGLGSGTSMAAPHVSGVVALMWSASGLVGDVAATRAALDASAVDTTDLGCGGDAANNNGFGQGRLDAMAATVEVAIDSGVTGVVTDATGQPISGVAVAVGQAGRERTTGDAGEYTIRLEPGSYTLEFSQFGLVTQTVSGVVVTEDNFTIVDDVLLEPAPAGGLAGTLTDAVSGHPVPGVVVDIQDVPVVLSATSGADGGYRIPSLPVGTYQLVTSSPVMVPVTAEVTITDGATTTVDLDLPPVPGGLDRVSVASDGTGGDDQSGDPVLSADGRYAAFDSLATNLVEDEVVADYNVYVHDRVTGETELVSLSDQGEPANGSSWKPSISADGRYVAFFSRGDNLVDGACDSGPCQQVYLRDRATGRTELVSANLAGMPADRPADGPSISADGRYVAFYSEATNLVADDSQATCAAGASCRQIYLRDRVTGEVELVSRHSDGEVGNDNPTRTFGVTGQPELSADGRYVAWQSPATNLVDEQTNPGLDVYLHDRETGRTEWVSPPGSPDLRYGLHTAPQLSDDGRFVSFGRSLPVGQPGTVSLSAVHDRVTGQTEPLSVPPVGDPPFALLSFAPAVSGDGRLAAFAQVAGDASLAGLPESSGIFVRDLVTGEHRRVVDTYDGSPPSGCGFVITCEVGLPAAVSADSRFVAVESLSDQLLPADTEGERDIYLVDLEFDQSKPRSRFAFSDLTVTPPEAAPGEPVEVAVDVSNVGDGAGAELVALRVDGAVAESVTVPLVPGEHRRLSFTVDEREGGSHRVQVAHLAGQFRVQSGTLAGAVTDANDDLPVEAVVTARNGDSVRTTTTIGGAYLFEDLQVGTWAVTVEADRYTTGTLTVEISQDRQRVTRDVALRSGVAAVPESIELTVPAGASGARELTLDNVGSADLSWEAFGWEAVTGAKPTVLAYSDDRFHRAPDTYLEQALRRLGLDFTLIYGDAETTGGFDRFEQALAEGDWDLVIFANEWLGNEFAPIPPSLLDTLHDHVASGGRLIAYARHLGLVSSHPLWERMGVAYAGDSGCWSGCADGSRENPPDPVHWWLPDHPMLTGPLPVPELTEWVNDSRGAGPWPIRYGNTGVRVEPLPGFEALAGATEQPAPRLASLVLGNDGRTLFRGFADGHNEADLDRNGIPDAVQLWVNSIVQVAELAPTPWLTVDGSGSIEPDGSAQLTVSVDASALAPGSYTGTVGVVTGAAREPRLTVPVTVTVEPVACDRTITGRQVGRLTIVEGTTCLAEGSRVVGPIQVRAGAGLVATGASVVGLVSAVGAAVLVLDRTAVIGPVTVERVTGWVDISDSQLRGPVRLVDNGTVPVLIVVSGNSVLGPLACTGNSPPPVDAGVPNRVIGLATGQCAGM